MGRPGLTNHRKFRRLARALGSDPVARGCLEFLWEACYENGDDYLGDSDDVESAARWTREPGVLTRALLEAGGEGNVGFIEQPADHPGHYHVHHLFDHAPEYVQKRMARESERKKRGQTISDLRRLAALASHKARASRQTGATGGHVQTVALQTDATGNHQTTVADDQAANGETPAPSPAPSPAPGETTTMLPDWMPMENWRGFVEMRQKMKSPLTPRAVAIVVKKLDTLRAKGADPAQLLDQSVMNGWKGIFPVRPEEYWNGNSNGRGKPTMSEIVSREQEIARSRAH